MNTLNNFTDLKKEPVVLNRQEAINYVLRISPQVNLANHRDICIRKAVEMLPENLNDKYAIDIGCGEGRWSRLLSQRGAEVLAIDNSQKIIEIAKQKSKNFKGITFEYLNFNELLFFEPQFDFGIAGYVFNNITNLSLIFQICNQIFNNNAELIIITKTFKLSKKALNKFKDYLLPIRINEKYTMHTSVFTFDDYKKVGKQNNLNLIDYFLQKSPHKFLNEGLNKLNITIEDCVIKFKKIKMH